MVYPKRLKPGDTVGIIAPAGPAKLGKVQDALPLFKQLGLKVKLGKSISKIHGYLAGTDEERLGDFHEMIADPEVKAIFCARGGYGTPRIVDCIDYDLVKNNPKIIWGYSDITYLHTAIYQQTGLITFHGPMLTSDIANPEFDRLSWSMFYQLFQPTEILYDEGISELSVISEGNATGKLVGGNLSLLVSTLGTPYEIDTRDSLLLLEDVDEVPYRVDSMLNQLRLSGKLEEAAGIVIGDFAGSTPKKQPSLTLEEVFQDYFGGLSCPVISGFKIGHCFPHIAVPLGATATLDTQSKILKVRPGVC